MLPPKFVYSFTLEAKTPRQCFLPKITSAGIHLEETNYFKLPLERVASSGEKPAHPGMLR